MKTTREYISDSYVYFFLFSVSGIFEFCNDSQECFGENVECQQNNCTCQNGSYFEYDQCSKSKW